MAEMKRSLRSAKERAAFVKECEERFEKRLDEVAAELVSSGTRIIALSGPTCSGKTTTANILKDRIIALGRHCEVVSLDHFYRNRDEEYPLNEDGSFDFENVTALRVDLFIRCLQQIFDREDCPLPRYDFKTSTRIENAELLNADVTFFQGDLFENVEGAYDIIVSNPPYIKSKVIEELMPEVKEFEPRMALDGTADGLLFYRRITAEAKRYLTPGGRLMFEIGHDQGDEVAGLLAAEGYGSIEVKKDYAGLDRMVFAVWPGDNKEN